MVCNNPKEMLAEIKKQMDLKNLKIKELAVMLNRSQQSVSQIFKICNPTAETLFEICRALNLSIDISPSFKSDNK